MKPIFAADSIGKWFGRRMVLKAASVWAVEGRITALMGRNGCGKSTLLRIGVGLIAADHGAVHFAGRTYLRPRLHLLARDGLCYLPQDGYLTPRLTLADHFEAVRRIVGRVGAPDLLDVLEIRDLLPVETGSFSGGERRRAELALAVAREPRCLLADESFAGISPKARHVLGRVFRELAGRGCAVVLTGHEVPELMEIADDVVWATGGTTHHLGTPLAAAHHEQFRRDYLGPGGWRAEAVDSPSAPPPRPSTDQLADDGITPGR